MATPASQGDRSKVLFRLDLSRLPQDVVDLSNSAPLRLYQRPLILPPTIARIRQEKEPGVNLGWLWLRAVP